MHSAFIACIEQPEVIAKILTHLGLWATPDHSPPVAGPRRRPLGIRLSPRNQLISSPQVARLIRHPGRCFPIILARGPNRASWEPDGAGPGGASRLLRSQTRHILSRPRYAQPHRSPHPSPHRLKRRARRPAFLGLLALPRVPRRSAPALAARPPVGKRRRRDVMYLSPGRWLRKRALAVLQRGWGPRPLIPPRS